MTLARQPAPATGSQRGTLFVEDAEVIAVRNYPGEQTLLKLAAPLCAARATAGSFIHLRCDPAIPMRRPLSIMRAAPAEGWVEVLFKVVGDGLRSLGQRKPGDRLSTIGPIGRGFAPSVARQSPLLIGGGVGIPPMIFLAETLSGTRDLRAPLLLMGSELPFPFELQRSMSHLDGLPPTVDRTLALLNNWQIPARLASLGGFDGCYPGYVTELASLWIASRTPGELADTEIFACGPSGMLAAVAALAQQFGLPCQVSLEEYMACAVGGCAGCTVRVREDAGPAMKRVCVDGPVFDAAQVFPL